MSRSNVTGLGSSTNFLASFLVTKGGGSQGEYTPVPVGAGNTLIAAMQQNRIEAAVTTDPTVSAAFVLLGYCRRWCVELAFFDSKQYLGLHDPRVWSERSVERAHPMAWSLESLVILWYCVEGHRGAQVERQRPWYTQKVTPTFTDMLGALRLQLWEHTIFEESGEEPPSPECIRRLLHTLSAVA